MRICLYTHTALPLVGGQELVVDALAREFQAVGHDVVVMAPGWRHANLRADRALPYRVVRHPRFVSMRKFVDWYAYWLRRENRRVPFDVIHSHGVYPTGYVVECARFHLGCPHVITAHGGDVRPENHHFQNSRLLARYSWTLSRAEALVAISQFTADGYQRLLGGNHARVVSIPNGTRLRVTGSVCQPSRELAAVASPGAFVLFLGRLHPQKGVDTLLRAWALLPRTTCAKLVIAGDGHERKSLEELSRSLGISNQVHFAGMVHGADKDYLLENALALMVPSRGSEGNSLTVLEGAAAGLPIIGTRIPGLNEQIRDGETGLLCEPDSPASIAEGLAWILSHRHEASHMGSRAKQTVHELSWAAIARRHLALYEKSQVCRAA